MARAHRWAWTETGAGLFRAGPIEGQPEGEPREDRAEHDLRPAGVAATAKAGAGQRAAQTNGREDNGAVDDQADDVEHGGEDQHLQDDGTGVRVHELREQRQHEQHHFRVQDIGKQALGEQAWEQLRILQGRPMPGTELTENYNPLEAGLWHTVSFNKGCYIGQETIARLNTYNGVKQQLWGLKLSQAAQPGAILSVAEQKVGVLTSIVETAEGFFGLGYLKTKAGGAGLAVTVGGSEAVTLDVPLLSRFQQPV